MEMRHKISQPSLWYIAWYKLYTRDTNDAPGLPGPHYYNPYYIFQVAKYETEQLKKSFTRNLMHIALQTGKLTPSGIDIILAKKPFSHTELHRTQQLHTSLTITRPMFIASKELRIDHSHTQIQRKWIPDPWITYLVAHKNKHFVRQIIILDRFIHNFIQSHILFPKDIHKLNILNILNTPTNCVICIWSDTLAIIFGPNAEIIWEGPIDQAVQAWVQLSNSLITPNIFAT